MLVRTPAIVLRRMRYGDSSIIATLLTAERGIESVIAKGARSPKSRIAAVLQPFEELDVQYYVKPGRELHILRSADRIVRRQRIPSRYEHAVIGYRILEMVLRGELPGTPCLEIYQLTSATLGALDTADANVELFPLAFGLRLALLHGYPMQLEECVDELSPTVASERLFNFRFDTGKAYPAESPSPKGQHLLSGSVIRALYLLQTSPLEELSSLCISPTDLPICQTIVQQYLEYHFERSLVKQQLPHV